MMGPNTPAQEGTNPFAMIALLFKCIALMCEQVV